MVMVSVNVYNPANCNQGGSTFTFEVLGTSPTGSGTLFGVNGKFVVVQNDFWVFSSRTNVD